MNIEENQDQFLSEVSNFKKDLINTLSTVNVEEYREEYKGRYSPERFRESFIEKAALHMLLKYILIRMIEESMGRVKVKLNEEGLSKWYDLSKNFKEDYELLYDIAVADVVREEGLSEIFEGTIYDTNRFIGVTKTIFSEYIPKLSIYDFSTLDATLTVNIIDTLLKPDSRNEMLNISNESPIINYILQEVGLK